MADAQRLSDFRTWDVFFASGSAHLRSNDFNRIGGAAVLLDRYPSALLVIEAYCDSTGNTAMNDRLAQRRAAAVQRALQFYTADPTRLIVQIYGSRLALVPGHGKVARSRNRCVRIRPIR